MTKKLSPAEEYELNFLRKQVDQMAMQQQGMMPEQEAAE